MEQRRRWQGVRDHRLARDRRAFHVRALRHLCRLGVALARDRHGDREARDAELPVHRPERRRVAGLSMGGPAVGVRLRHAAEQVAQEEVTTLPSLFLSLVGAGIAAIGAVLVAWPVAKLSNERIQGIASTVYGANPVLVTTLLEQRRYAGWGIVAIAVGVGLQLVAVV